ncbi:hypothetical protein DPEC_G00306340 [Dallia pectoralis]|uniref:Uncharacterized protein n=1 Tax=Dallia pectoralis TaxID=75939 RepID=A0ACC2FE67_DALPE|nr:hypothetical protein DPEC_G00306340 [Dallia pectoralis]
MKRCEVSESCQGTRPQRNQTKLVCGLLLWVSLLTISQVLFIALFFITTSAKQKTTSDVGQLFTFDAKEATNSGVIQWKTQTPEKKLLEDNGINVKILHDGSYFIYLQVTLTSVSSCDVKVTTTDRGVVLQGRMTNASLSTGFLGRAVKLTAPDTLKVTISTTGQINIRNIDTYLGILLLKD